MDALRLFCGRSPQSWSQPEPHPGYQFRRALVSEPINLDNLPGDYWDDESPRLLKSLVITSAIVAIAALSLLLALKPEIIGINKVSQFISKNPEAIAGLLSISAVALTTLSRMSYLIFSDRGYSPKKDSITIEGPLKPKQQPKSLLSPENRRITEKARPPVSPSKTPSGLLTEAGADAALAAVIRGSAPKIEVFDPSKWTTTAPDFSSAKSISKAPHSSSSSSSSSSAALSIFGTFDLFGTFGILGTTIIPTKREIVRYDEKSLHEMTEKLSHQITEKLDKNQKIISGTSTRAGIHNLGVTCYIAAALQGFFEISDTIPGAFSVEKRKDETPIAHYERLRLIELLLDFKIHLLTEDSSISTSTEDSSRYRSKTFIHNFLKQMEELRLLEKNPSLSSNSSFINYKSRQDDPGLILLPLLDVLVNPKNIHLLESSSYSKTPTSSKWTSYSTKSSTTNSLEIVMEAPEKASRTIQEALDDYFKEDSRELAQITIGSERITLHNGKIIKTSRFKNPPPLLMFDLKATYQAPATYHIEIRNEKEVLVRDRAQISKVPHQELDPFITIPGSLKGEKQHYRLAYFTLHTPGTITTTSGHYTGVATSNFKTATFYDDDSVSTLSKSNWKAYSKYAKQAFYVPCDPPPPPSPTSIFSF